MKQETTSEGFYRISKEIDYSEFDFISFKIGIEWKQEQDKNKYSEKEAWNMCSELASYFIGGDTFDLKKWFKQFKK